MEIVHFPHPTLRYKSRPLKRVDAELFNLIRQMFDLMYEAEGVGLAANQVDLPFRMFIVNLAAHPSEGEEMVFLNPVLKPAGKHPSVDEAEEGCLSLPGLYGPVVRPTHIRVTAYNLQGEKFDATVDGILARVVQHETDHLEGILFFDRMTETARLEAKQELRAFEEEFETLRQENRLPADDQITAKLRDWENRYC